LLTVAQKKSLDVIQLFHKAGSPTSTKAADLLKRISIRASESASEDKASRDPFELQVTEEPPTQDQLQTMLDYAGDKGISSIVEGASTSSEALRLVRENVDKLRRPIVCSPFPLFPLAVMAS
jgi:arsenate reductase-like glutaredoxin family protein